jgi:hypothetical protein
MNNLIEQETMYSSVSPRQPFSSLPYRLLYLFTWTTVVAALVVSILLLVNDVFSTILPHAPVSAAPLLLIGVASLGFQVLIRPKPLDLFKALIVSSAFILWGIDQLLPLGWEATTLGDVVIVLYVVDLGWMMIDRLKQQWKTHHTTSRNPEHERSVSSSEADDGEPLLPLLSPIPGKQHYTPQQIIMISRGSTPFLKRNRLAPLPCTCASPLAPFQSSTCCREMQEASRS